MLYQLSYARVKGEFSEGRAASQACPALIRQSLTLSGRVTLLPYGEITSYLYPVTSSGDTNSPRKIWNWSTAGAWT